MAGRNAKAVEAEPIAVKDETGAMIAVDFSSLDTAGAWRTGVVSDRMMMRVVCPCGCGLSRSFFTDDIPKGGQMKGPVEIDCAKTGFWKGRLIDGIWTEDVPSSAPAA
jgi:hypothetical protein